MQTVTTPRCAHAPSTPAADHLAAIRCVLAAAGRSAPLSGLAPDLVVAGGAGWVPATSLADGSRTADLVERARQRFDAPPAASVALAWKAYSFWLALPAVLGWASARQVPLLRPEHTLVHLGAGDEVPRLGLRPDTPVAVLPHDPLALRPASAVTVVPDEAALLAALGDSLRTAHVDPVLGQLRALVRVSARTLLGSLASGVAHAVVDAADVLPGPVGATVDTLLTALGVADLVSVAPAADGGWSVQRRTCCLAFTLPEPKICDGCCLRTQ